MSADVAKQPRVVLASASPRRREILTQLGITFDVEVRSVDEELLPGEDPSAYVLRLSEAKAHAVAAELGQAESVVVIGADTTVVVDGEVLGKPTDVAESEQMLRKLVGRSHGVHTGVSVVVHPAGAVHRALATTSVRFRAFSEQTLRGYAASREGLDKAGSYGIQGLGAGLVEAIEGSYTNVVGLPAAETLALLERAGAIASWP